MEVGDLVTYDDFELAFRVPTQNCSRVGVILEIMSWVDSSSYNLRNRGVHIKVMWQDTGTCSLHEYDELRLVD